MKNSAFTLVELAIVIVIIGLLIGGVLKGQELIKQAQLRTVIKDVEAYKGAALTFKSKYNAIPGDIANATQIWGAATTCPPSIGGNNGSLTCNGNGDMLIGWSPINGDNNSNVEEFLFWQHLSLARIIKGSYTGAWGTGGARHAIPNRNVPNGPLSGSGYTVYNLGNYTLFGTWPYAKGNTLVLGKNDQSAYETHLPVLGANDTYSLDLKIDDGLPGLGKLTSGSNSTNVPNCVVGTAASTATYNIQNNDADCALYFFNQF